MAYKREEEQKVQEAAKLREKRAKVEKIQKKPPVEDALNLTKSIIIDMSEVPPEVFADQKKDPFSDDCVDENVNFEEFLKKLDQKNSKANHKRVKNSKAKNTK